MKKLFLSLSFFFLFIQLDAQIINTIAGNGTQGYSGDGGPAKNALLNGPGELCFDKLGNIYIADGQNNCVRKIDVNGIITTVAGNGIRGFSGDGGLVINAQLKYPRGISLDNLGNLYIADYVNNRIRKVDITGIITTIAGTGVSGYSSDGILAC
jgi:hypothetical protein